VRREEAGKVRVSDSCYCYNHDSQIYETVQQYATLAFQVTPFLRISRKGRRKVSSHFTSLWEVEDKTSFLKRKLKLLLGDSRPTTQESFHSWFVHLLPSFWFRAVFIGK